TLHVAERGLAAHRHRTVDPGADLDWPPARYIATEARRNLDGEAELARAHPSVELRIVRDRLMLDEVARAGQIEGVIAAGGGLVPIEDGERQILDIHIDSVPHYQHQDDAADQRQRHPD